ncbi:concanavalin A-like lectin/glucanase domain-containing protein [Xylariaceae sp. FL1272]|nr:concanavalin A-like lectin/glucanase domain-containing protein [Xylariaceae sp. FL1272]
MQCWKHLLRILLPSVLALSAMALLPSPVPVPHSDTSPPVNSSLTYAGATIDIPRGNNTQMPAVGSVYATWTVPRLCLGEGTSNVSREVMTWIGVSGKDCDPIGALVQVGVQINLNEDNTTSARAWASWYPAIGWINVVGFDVRPGDTVTVALSILNTTNALIQMANKRTNHLATQSVFSPEKDIGDFELCSSAIGDGRVWAVVEGAFKWNREPPDTPTSITSIPYFEDVSFRSLTAKPFGKGDEDAVNIHAGGGDGVNGTLYQAMDLDGVRLGIDTLGKDGFQIFGNGSCVGEMVMD